MFVRWSVDLFLYLLINGLINWLIDLIFSSLICLFVGRLTFSFLSISFLFITGNVQCPYHVWRSAESVYLVLASCDTHDTWTLSISRCGITCALSLIVCLIVCGVLHIRSECDGHCIWLCNLPRGQGMIFCHQPHFDCAAEMYRYMYMCDFVFGQIRQIIYKCFRISCLCGFVSLELNSNITLPICTSTLADRKANSHSLYKQRWKKKAWNLCCGKTCVYLYSTVACSVDWFLN